MDYLKTWLASFFFFFPGRGCLPLAPACPLTTPFVSCRIPEQGIEGIVFHCRRAGDSKTVMFKVHCHHLDLSCWGSHDRAKTRLSRMTDFGEEEAES